MKLSSRRFKFLGISILALLIFIPLIVFGYDYFDLPSGFKILDVSSLGRGKMCVQNSSANTYFVPARTDVEFSSFLVAVGRLNVTLLGSCCGDGICSGSDNCSNCSNDCGGCICSSFTYSPWSGCSGGTQTRSVLSQSPASCTGGGPVTSQSCSCTAPGCATGTCRNASIYLSANNCTGGVINQSNNCINANTPNYSCIYGGSSTSQYYVPASGCTQAIACNTPGCPYGSSCRTGYPYLGTGNCTGGTAGPIYSLCIADTDPNNSCISYNSITSINYVPGSGCSY